MFSFHGLVCSFIIAVVGVGLLALPGAFSQLGWPLAFFVLIVVTLISVYSALILAWLKGAMRHITTYPGLAGVVTEFKGPLGTKERTNE